MKLSEMTNDQAAEALIRLAEPVGKLCDDEEAVKLISEYKKTENKPLYYVVGRIIPRLVSYFMVEHKRDIYEIVSVFSGVKAEDIGKMKLTETVKIIQDSYDDMAMTFFPSSGTQTKGGDAKLSVL